MRYEYDDYGRRVAMYTFQSGDYSVTEPPLTSPSKTEWIYDGDPADPDGIDNGTGLLVAKLDAAGKGATYTYETGGRLKTRTWARGGTTTYGYDPQTGELLTVDYSDATPDIAYTYDSLGRQKTVTDAQGVREFFYDPATLQLEREEMKRHDQSVIANIHRKHETGAEPNGVPGRAAGLYLDDSENYNVTYGYSGVGRFEKVHWRTQGANPYQATYGYTPSSNLLRDMNVEEETDPDVFTSRQTTSYQYEYESGAQRDLKSQVKNVFGAATVSQYDYRYDELGRRKDVVTSGQAFVDDVGAPQSELSLWAYNDRNELTASNRHEGTNPDTPGAEDTDEKRSYLYDPIGNRTSALGQDGVTPIAYEDGQGNAGANSLNQYKEIDGNPLTYDDDGNMTIDADGRTLTYNGEDRLVQFDDGQGTVANYEYDYIGRRVKKTVGSETTTYVWDGWNQIRETTDDGANGTTTKHNVWGLDLSQSMQGAGGIGGLVAVVSDGGSASLFAYDGNGNVGQVASASDGSEQASYEYDAFGNVVVMAGVGAEDNAWRFSTKAVDAESGYSYYGYRYYSAHVGRWINRDPAGERGGLNLQAFVSNRATLLVDTLGRQPSLVEPEFSAVPDEFTMLPADQQVCEECYPEANFQVRDLARAHLPQNPATDPTRTVTPTNPAPGNLDFRLTRQQAEDRYGAYDLTTMTWDEKGDWLIDWPVPPDITRNPNYRWKRAGSKVTVIREINRDLAPYVEQALRNLLADNLLCQLDTLHGPFVVREVQNSNRLSMHAYGAALDVNRAQGPRLLTSAISNRPGAAQARARHNNRARNPTMGVPFVAAWTRTGLTWGFHFEGRGGWHPDAMHFSLGF